MSNSVTKVLIEAGAGSGKTYTLVSKIIDLLKTGKALPHEISAITFTNAAASEMKGRYQEEVLKEENNPNIAKVIGEMDDLCVSTIHSFCNNILSLFPFELGLSLDRKIITENKDIAKRNNELFERAISETEELSDICRVFGVQTTVVKDMFVDMLNSNIDKWKKYDLDKIDYEKIEEVKKRCASCYNRVKNIIQIHTEKFDKALQQVIFKWKAYNDFFNNPDIKEFTIENYKTINEQIVKEYKEKKETLKCYIYKQSFRKQDGLTEEDKQKVKDENELLSDELLSLHEELISSLKEYKNVSFPIISNVMIKLVEKAEAERRFMSVITNDETLLYTSEILNYLIKNNIILPESLRYKYIFIDEFQDTDPLQIDIVNALGTLITASGTDVTFYFIGDPKQSIYQFRGADLNCYLKTSKEIEEAQKTDSVHYITSPLKKNYRSNPKMIEYFNRIFSSEDYFCVDKNDFSYTLTSPGFERDENVYKNPKVLSGVCRSDMEKNGKKENADAQEATYIALLIQHYVSNEYLIYDKDAKDKIRPVRYSDFMVITPDNKQEAFLRSFGAINVSVNLEGRETPNTKEVMLLRGMLKYFSDIDDEEKVKIDKVYLEEVLTNKFIDDEQTNKDKEKLLKLFSFLDVYKNKNVSVFVEEVVPFISSLVQSDNREQIFQVVEMLKSGRLSSYEETYKALCDIKEINRRLRLTENTNAVKVINLHKSKGLQGGIVILGGHFKIKKKQTKNIGYITNNGEKEGVFNIYSSSATQGGNESVFIKSDLMSEALEREEKDRAEEEKRLMYVAATRAKEMLIILNHKSETAPYEGYWSDLLDDDVPLISSDQSINGITLQEQNNSCDKNDLSPQYKVFAKDDITSLVSNKTIIVNPSKLRGIKEDKTIITDGEADKREQIQSDYTLLQPLKGTIIHAIFENAINRIKASKSKAEEVKNLLKNDKERFSIIAYALTVCLFHFEEKCDYQKIISANIEELDKILKLFLSDEELQIKLQKADRIYTELPFEYSTPVSGDDDKIIVIKGIMDLVLVFDNNECSDYEIWDYKTTENIYDDVNGFEKRLYDEYNEQLQMYKKALYDIFSQNGEITNILPPKIYHLYR